MGFQEYEIEYDCDGILQTRIFYCDPSCPHQKGAIEVNHELIRRILPKGTSLDSLTQDDIHLVMNHVNSCKRKKLTNGKLALQFTLICIISTC